MKLILAWLLIGSCLAHPAIRLQTLDIAGGYLDQKFTKGMSEGSDGSSNYNLKPKNKLIKIVHRGIRIWYFDHPGEECTFCHVTLENQEPMLVLLLVQYFNDFFSVKRFRYLYESWVPISKDFYEAIERAINGYEDEDYDMEIDINSMFDRKRLVVLKEKIENLVHYKITPKVGFHIDLVRSSNRILWKRTLYQDEVLELHLHAEEGKLKFCRILYETYYETADTLYFVYDNGWKKTTREGYYQCADPPDTLRSSHNNQTETGPDSDEDILVYDKEKVLGTVRESFADAWGSGSRSTRLAEIVRQAELHPAQLTVTSTKSSGDSVFEAGRQVIEGVSSIGLDTKWKGDEHPDTDDEEVDSEETEEAYSDIDYGSDDEEEVRKSLGPKAFAKFLDSDKRQTTAEGFPVISAGKSKRLNKEFSQPRPGSDQNTVTPTSSGSENASQQPSTSFESRRSRRRYEYIQPMEEDDEEKTEDWESSAGVSETTTSEIQSHGDPKSQDTSTTIPEGSYMYHELGNIQEKATEGEHGQRTDEAESQLPYPYHQYQLEKVQQFDPEPRTSHHYQYHDQQQQYPYIQQPYQYLQQQYPYLQQQYTYLQQQQAAQQNLYQQYQQQVVQYEQQQVDPYTQQSAPETPYQQYQQQVDPYAQQGVAPETPYQQYQQQVVQYEQQQVDPYAQQQVYDYQQQEQLKRYEEYQQPHGADTNVYQQGVHPYTYQGQVYPQQQAFDQAHTTPVQQQPEHKKKQVDEHDFTLQVRPIRVMSDVPDMFQGIMQMAPEEKTVYKKSKSAEEKAEMEKQTKKAQFGFYGEQTSLYTRRGKISLKVDLKEIVEDHPYYILEPQAFHGVRIFKITPTDGVFFNDICCGTNYIWRSRRAGRCLGLKAVVMNGEFKVIELIMRKRGGRMCVHYKLENGYYKNIHTPTYINIVSQYAMDLYYDNETNKRESERRARREREMAYKFEREAEEKREKELKRKLEKDGKEQRKKITRLQKAKNRQRDDETEETEDTPAPKKKRRGKAKETEEKEDE